ncbi:MAG: hypothetical protein Q8P19_02695 [bacterium]|nr:hypothetical protein [bacterium]
MNESRHYREFENTYPALNGRIVQKYVDDPTLGPGIEFTKDKQLTEDLFEAYKIMFALITEEDLRAYYKAEGGSSGIDYLGKNFLLTA